MAVNPIPDGYPQVTPYLCIDGAAAAIDFYAQVFGATERFRMAGPDERVGHAELQLGSSVIMLADPFPDIDWRPPREVGGTPVMVHIYVEDVDAVFARALASGATALRAVEDQFYGDRTGTFEDPYGHRWSVASHIEDVLPDEMERRAAEAQPHSGHG